mmetsp:Transcript_24438/g.34258  ORF Transcript_24438/g.34258 Transcript_24438/m.34258 type:complete len:319 (+) Transcript_24438:52-1008(+)
MANASNSAAVHALAGSGGGVLAYMLTYPLGTISTRLQVQTSNDQSSDQSHVYQGTVDAILKIIKSEGWQGLYSGYSAGLTAVAATQGIYYYWYEWIRAYVEDVMKSKNLQFSKDLVNLAIAAVAGSITATLTNPLWVVNVRMTLQKKNLDKTKNEKPKGFFAVMSDMVRDEGLTSFWKGIVPALILVSNPAIQYMVFEKLKAMYEAKRPGQKLTPLHHFLLGAIGKTIATIITYPYIVVKSRLQMKQPSNNNQPAYQGTSDVLSKIWANEGFFGFFKGMQSKIVQSVLNAAFLFYFKEELVQVVVMLLAAASRLRLKQ